MIMSTMGIKMPRPESTSPTIACVRAEDCNPMKPVTKPAMPRTIASGIEQQLRKGIGTRVTHPDKMLIIPRTRDTVARVDLSPGGECGV